MDGLIGAQIERKGEETERRCDLGPDGVAEHGVVLELPSERDGLVDVLPHSIAALLLESAVTGTNMAKNLGRTLTVAPHSIATPSAAPPLSITAPRARWCAVQEHAAGCRRARVV